MINRLQNKKAICPILFDIWPFLAANKIYPFMVILSFVVISKRRRLLHLRQ